MIDHLEIAVSDLAASSAFYTAALAPLGYRHVVAREAVCGFGTSEISADFWVRTGGPSQPLPHVAFNCTSRELVQRCHEAAVAAGAPSQVVPALLPRVHANYFTAQVLDPDGHLIEFACHAVE